MLARHLPSASRGLSGHPSVQRPSALWGPIFGAVIVACSAGTTAAVGTLPTEVTKALRLHEISEVDLSLYVQEVTEAAPRVSINAQVPRPADAGA